jgi:Lantibiotic biosynthesis dehydratase C-term
MTDDATAPREPFPDPIITANVYCAGRLDEVIHSALAPLRLAMAEEDPEDLWRLWFVRYPRRGEHLKVRLHGPETAALRLRQLLEDAVETCLAALPVESGELQPRKDGREVPPIDAEDESTGLQPDRSLLWTHYRRNHIFLGGPPLLGDDRYADLITASLGRAGEIVLAALRPDGEGRFPNSPRQTALFRLVTGGLGALGWGVEKSAGYLAYHRDWLLRFAASRSNTGSEKIAQTLAQFDRKADQMGAALEPLRAMALDAWDVRSGGPRDSLDGTDGGWWRALRDFQDYLDRFRGDPDYQLDPFAADVVFSPVFKVFHGSANQLGLNMLNEAFAHHLLWRAVAA